MSPEQRSELEAIVSAHSPSIGASERQRLLFEAARELGRQQANRQMALKLVAAAASSCVLTLLMSWTVMLGGFTREAGAKRDVASVPTPAHEASSAAASASQAIAHDNAQPTESLPFDNTAAVKSRFDRNTLTPVGWPARWQLSLSSGLDMDALPLEPEHAPQTERSGSASETTPLRVGTLIDHF